MKRLLALMLCAVSLGVGAQIRFLHEVFTEVDVTTDVIYGSNVTILPLLQGAPPAAQPLVCDIYEPAGDTETDRPLIIYIHTGDFLPQYLNGSAVGAKNDSCAVELCSRYAKMGYVVASIDYRLGWNPLAQTQADRTYQLINAIYRGVQDARTAVRFFRMTEATMGNPYGIDPAKIGYFGEGAGGYVSYAASTIEDYNDIILDDMGVPIAKFWTGTPGQADYIPMVIEPINGDPEAITDGFAPAGEFGPDPFQLCIANHVGYSSDVSFQVNLGGALGDLNWLDAGDPAMISFQCPADQFAPYTTGVLVEPTFNENVVEVSGAFDIHAEINAQMMPNNNGAFQSLGLSDVYSAQATANGNQGWDGLYPVLNDYVGGSPTQPFDGAPWQWWDVATTELVDAANGTTIAQTQLTLNPNMGPLEGRAYCDTIVGYAAPRMAALLGLAYAVPGCTTTDACNYDDQANLDNGSCDYSCIGCTDPEACNYDETATTDDGSCEYDSCAGCTDPGACNFDPNAIEEDGSCEELDALGVCGGFCGADADADDICDDVDDCVGDVDAIGVCNGGCGQDFDMDGICDDVDDCVGVLDPCGICNGPGVVYECGCADFPEGDCDCNGNQLDAVGVCGGDCTEDADADGICDDIDDCVGDYDACGICNGPGDIYECGCTDIPAGDCDCDGNQLDALGVCGGDCTADADADGICDDVDDCVGAYDACGICNGPGEIYECGCADIPEGDCDCDGNVLDECGVCNGPGAIYECGCVDIPQDFCDCDLNQLDALAVCGGDCAEDANSDGICDDLLDCVNIGAAFWQDLELGVYLSEPTPITPDSLPIDGIQLTVGEDFTNELILNVPLVFVDEVTGGAFQVLSWSNLTVEDLPPGVELILPEVFDGGSQACVELTGDDYPTQEGFYEVVITGEVLLNIFGAPFSIGDVSTSFWIEVVSNPNGVPGCTYPTASNYMPWATYDSGVCEYAGCTDPTALNYSPRHSVDDGSCFYNDPNCVAEAACPEDLNGDGAVGTPDLLLMLGEYGNFCD